MTCETAQELILESGPSSAEAADHVAVCESCRQFAGFQAALDQKLTKAYAAPVLAPAFRSRLRARVKHEKRKRWEGAIQAALAPAAALATSAVCAIWQPELASFLFSVGIGVSAAGYAGNLLFVWLTEELGEG